MVDTLSTGLTLLIPLGIISTYAYNELCEVEVNGKINEKLM